MEKKVYSGWAFTSNEGEKANINLEIYEELKAQDFKGFKYQHAGSGYAHIKYYILENPNNLSMNEMALICDSGNLCFGYRTEGKTIVIYTD